MASWPGTLPATPLLRGYAESPPDLTIRTQMDQGPAKIRRRFTAAPRPMRFAFNMTTAQIAILDTFYVTTLSGGALTFTFTNPRTAATDTYRFLSPPTYTPWSGSYWRVELDLEIVAA